MCIGVELFDDLIKNRMMACGTFRKRRKNFPKEIIEEVEKENNNAGNISYRQCGKLVATAWIDKKKNSSKTVLFMSTCCQPDAVDNVKRNDVDVVCPKFLPLYNKYGHTVDRVDQMRHNYSMHWRSRKWWLCMTLYFLDIAVMNAYVMAKRRFPDKYQSQKEFRIELMHQLVEGYSERKKKKRKAVCYPIAVKNRKRCTVCPSLPGESRNGSKPMYGCGECGVSVCIGECFKQQIMIRGRQ